MKSPAHKYEGFGPTIELANSLGFMDDAIQLDLQGSGPYTPGVADALEEAAIEYIRGKGHLLVGYDD